jgi:hypothetical protein
MTDSPWDKMPIEAKLEWLRAAVERITETDKRNIDAQNAMVGRFLVHHIFVTDRHALHLDSGISA